MSTSASSSPADDGNNNSSTSESQTPYVPPLVWSDDQAGGSKMTMNRPTAGARFERTLPIGTHPIQLYSMGTPNGQKVTILLEELLEMGINDAEYDAWLVNIMKEDQFGSDFVAVNPNSKIPAMSIHDKTDPDHPTVINVWESGNILFHLAERFSNSSNFLPKDLAKRTETMNWLFWLAGSAPYLGGGFGHFYMYANEKQKYPIDRFTMETKRQLDVLDKQLATKKYIIGDDYTIADMAIYPWYGALVLGTIYTNAHVFLNANEEYPNVIRWARDIEQRPAVQRGILVNKSWGDKQVPERHSRSDFDNVLGTTNQSKM